MTGHNSAGHRDARRRLLSDRLVAEWRADLADMKPDARILQRVPWLPAAHGYGPESRLHAVVLKGKLLDAAHLRELLRGVSPMSGVDRPPLNQP